MPVSDNPRDYTWGKRKKNIYLWVGIGVVVVIGLVVAGYFVFQNDTPGADPVLVNTQQTPTTTRVLDGVEVSDPAFSNLFPLAIMVENLSTTRPQSGLSKAGVVYEALAEGGITRFLGIFTTHEEIPQIGPVRSARPYFVEWAKEYDGMYVHVGGSPQGLERIQELDIRDFDQFYNSGNFKIREDKVRPHHMFTDSRLMTFGTRDEGYPETASFLPWKFEEGPDLADRPVTDQAVSIDFSTFSYEVEYVYDRQSNTYLRSQGGAAFTDETGNTRIAPKNVVLQFVSISNFDTQRLDITTTGTGTAIIFKNGEAIEGTWKKETKDSRTYFYGSDGNEITFTAGQTWIEVLEKDRNNYSYS